MSSFYARLFCLLSKRTNHAEFSDKSDAFHFANGAPVGSVIPILIECFITQKLIARDAQKSAKAASCERFAAVIGQRNIRRNKRGVLTYKWNRQTTRGVINIEILSVRNNHTKIHFFRSSCYSRAHKTSRKYIKLFVLSHATPKLRRDSAKNLNYISIRL